MTDDRAAIARLAHDVGKHIARAARNLPEKGPIPAPLARMLESDLYALSDGRPASAVFEGLAALLDGDSRTTSERDELGRVRAHLTQIDSLRARVRSGDESAQRRAASLALAVSDALAALLREGEQ